MTSAYFDIASSEKILNPACSCRGKCVLSDPAKILMPSELFFFPFPRNMTLPCIVQWLRVA